MLANDTDAHYVRAERKPVYKPFRNSCLPLSPDLSFIELVKTELKNTLDIILQDHRNNEQAVLM